MALTSSTQYGVHYEWGFQDADAPAIDNKFVPRSADLSWEPEVNTQAVDGEGHADSVTRSKKNKQKITASFTGYVLDGFDPEAVPETFPFLEGSAHQEAACVF